MKTKLILGAIGALFLVFVAWLVFVTFFAQGNYDDFAQCLSEKDYVMAGTEWCSFCKQQKGLFGPSFKYVTYKDCDIEKQWCAENNISTYPRWVSPTGQQYVGVQSLEKLSELSGCSLQ